MIGDAHYKCPVCGSRHEHIITVTKDEREALCDNCKVASVPPRDGLHGTDNVLRLVPNKPKEEPGPSPNAQYIIQACDDIARDAALGKLTALAVVGFMTDGTIICGTFGKGNYTEFLGGLEDLKYQIILEHQRQQPRKPK